MADEINRASPRTQSALLQAMQEQHVTVAGARHDLPRPFHVLATQNPLEQEGTYPLPEAQLDRFLMEVDVDYPDLATERKILFDTTGAEAARAAPAMTADDLIAAQRLRAPFAGRQSPSSKRSCDWCARRVLVRSRHVGKLIYVGPGHARARRLMLAVRARALLEGRFTPYGRRRARIRRPVLKRAWR